MELRHYRYFLAAAEELNISKASRRLNVSQPAMSRLIHDLEAELGVSLFERQRFGLALSPAGEKLLVYARQILDLSNEAVRTLRNQPAQLPSITVGFLTSSLGSFIGAALKAFRAEYPDLSVKILELSPAEQVKALHKGAIDIALVGNPCGAVHDEFETRVLFEMSLDAVLPSTHRLARRKSISLKELAEEDFIGYREDSFPGRNQTIITACKVAGFTPHFVSQAYSLVEVLAMIGAGTGVCLMPADVSGLPHPDSAFVKIKEKLEPIRFTAAWKRNDERLIIQRFIDRLEASSRA